MGVCGNVCCVAVIVEVSVLSLGVLKYVCTGSGVNGVHVLLSGFIVRLYCFVQAKTLSRYGYMYFLAVLVLVCVAVMVMSSAQAMT